MSEVRNRTALAVVFQEEWKLPPVSAERRGEFLEELAALVGSPCLQIREGRLELDVPLALALEHVDSSVLVSAAGYLRRYARAVIRAAATLDEAVFCDWADSFSGFPDHVGHGVGLGADGAVRFDVVDGARQVVVGEIEKEAASAGIAARYPLGQQRNCGHHSVAQDDLVRSERASFDHSDPLSDPIVPRRATPPP